MADGSTTESSTPPADVAPLLGWSEAVARPQVRWAVRAAGTTVAIIGATYLLAWLAGVAARWSAAGVITMKTNMSLALALAGAALLLLEPERVGAARRALGVLAAAIVLVIGLATLAEHLFQLDLRIDQLIAAEPPRAVATVSPNRIGPPGSTSLVLIGAGLLALAWRRRLAFYPGLVTSLIVLVPAVGFLYGIDPFYGRAELTGIAWPTVIALSLLSAGLLLADPEGPLALVWREDAGGVLLRRLLPVAVAIPLALGYVRVQAERLGLFGASTGNGLFSLVLVVVLSSFLWRSARQLSVAAAHRVHAEEQARWRAGLLDLAHDAILVWSPEGGIESWNRGAEELYGFDAAEALGRRLDEVLASTSSPPWPVIEAELARAGRWEGELRRSTKDGAQVTVSAKLQVVRGLGGSLRVLETDRDVTAEKRAEASLRESEQRYAAIFERSPFAIALNRLPGAVIVAVNDAFVELFGRSRDAAVGKTSVELGFSDAESQDHVRAEFERRGFVRDFEVVRRSSSGARHVLSLNLDRVRLGGEDFVLTTIQDVTEKRRAQDQVAEEKERLAVTLRSIGDAVIATDLEARVTLMNRVAEALTGWRAEDAIGKPLPEVFRIVDEETRQPASNPVERVLRERTVVGLANHTALVARDGSERPISDSAAPIRDAAGGVTGVVLVFRDQTEKRRADEALRAQDRELRALAESMPQLAWIARPDGYVTWYNRRWYEYTATTAEQMEGWGWQSVHDPATLPDVLRRWRESLATSTAFEMEFPLRGADGTFRRFLTRVVPLQAQDGAVVRWFGTSTDVTELIEAQEALKDAARRKDDFLGMLSHELRNPLAPIRNSVYVLEHANPAGEQAARARKVIQRQTEHLARLVDDLLDVTRIARGKVALRRERVDLRAVVERTAEDLRPTIEDRGVAFRVELPDAQVVRADADETRIAQIVGNLLNNAAKFTRRGDSVTLSLRAKDGIGEITVRDTGAGIEPSLLADLFQPFVQGGRTLARSEGGLGLGLALVKGIAELHGGTVRAESEGVGKGATVTVRLPLGDGTVRDPQPSPEVTAAKVRRRVLVVDDNADSAESLAAMVELLGHAAEVAYDGPSALEKARASRPDLVLCDIGLPGMSGYEVARALRAELTGVRLVAVTGYGQAEDVRAAMQAGFDRHVTKPLDPRDVGRLLET
jgi:PAS domain S-box-containing protein